MSIAIEFKLDTKDQKYTHLKSAFVEKLKQKFTVEDYSPIINYVLTYLNEAKRTKDETVNEMRDLFNEHCEDIVNWLWNYIEKNINTKHNLPEENKDLVEEIIQEKFDNTKIGSQIFNPNDKKEDKKQKNIFNSAIENIRDDKKKKLTKYSDNNLENSKDEKIRTVKIGDKSIIIKKKVKRERSRENDREHNHKFEKKFNNKFDRNQNQIQNQRSFKEFKNRGRGGKFHQVQIRKNFEQQHYQKDYKKLEQTKNENINQQQSDKTEIKEQEQKEPNVEENHSKKKIRCKNWPNCKKNELCEYHHPTETCQYFPKCTFGNSCLYIHPNIPCKYGFYCTRIGCSYSHSSGYNPSSYQPFMQQGIAYPSPHFKNMKLDNTKKDINNNLTNEPKNEIDNKTTDSLPNAWHSSNIQKPTNTQFFPNMKLVKNKSEEVKENMNGNNIHHTSKIEIASYINQGLTNDVEMR